MRLHWGLCFILASACSSETHAVSPVNDTCTTCHTNITQAHPNATITCVQCHGGQQLEAADIAAVQGSTFGDPNFQAVLDKAHVHPKQGNEQLFLAAGLTNQTGACFRGADDPTCNGGDKDGVGTVDDAVDSEYNRDLNYVRFINPGDLRVAQASCGGQSPRAGDYPSAAGGCHTDEVSRVRRSIMATQAGVVSAAYLGNLGSSQQMGNSPAPRGYVFNLDGAGGSDECFHTDTNKYDSACLEGHRAFPANDHLSGLDSLNVGQEVFPGTLQQRAGSNLMQTIEHTGFAIRIGGIGGQPLDMAKAWPSMEPVSGLTNADLGIPATIPACAPGLVTVNPLDAVLRGFRAYYPLWIPGTGKNFAAVAGNTINHADDPTKAFNPFGRGHASGCTGCHMLYEFDGKSHEPNDLTLQAAGRFPTLDLVEGGNAQQQGMSVVQEQFSGGIKQQRFYPAKHALTSKIPTRQCGYCHTFVTRIDLAYQGMYEVEEGDILARKIADRPQSGDITFTTPAGTHVRIFDALERVEPAGGGTFHITTDPRVKDYQTVLATACAQRGINCDDAGIYTFDFNGNGELDDGEDLFQSGELLLPDRIPRRAQTDGRQMRILYGGENGSTQMKDVHLLDGMHCIDCHFYQDVHGDGNIYNTNWETIEIECEDCHGYAQKRAQDVNPGQLLTSGPNGGNDLMKATDGLKTAQFPGGRPFFEVRDGKLFQRSRVTPGLEWEVKQTVDVQMPDVHDMNHVGTGPRAESAGKLECYSCHNTMAPNCLTCHYQENYSKKQLEVWLAGSLQPQKTDFQLFGMIRGPLILGIDGDAEHNRLSPFRSSMEAFVSVADCAGQTAFGNVIHSNCRAGKAVSGVGMNNFMPHAVRTDIARGCETCHTAKDRNGNVVNNHLVAQTLGLGTGRLNDLGDWLFVASSSTLDVVDIKDESELGDTHERNSFPGFLVGNKNAMGATQRSFTMTPSGSAFTPKDAALVRGFNGNLCMQEVAVNADIAIVAGGAGGLFVFNAFTPDTLGGGPKPFAHAAGNVVAVDVVGQDISDPIVYAADASAGLVTYDLSGLSPFGLGTPTTIGARFTTAGWPAGAPALGVKVAGNRAIVGAGSFGLIVVDVSNAHAPQVVGAPIPLCFSDESMSCGRAGGRVTVQNVIAYVATNDGLVAVDLSASPPHVIGGLRGALVNDVALSGHLAFLAAGANGVHVVDITAPAAMVDISSRLQLTDPTPINQATGIVVGTVPTQTWIFVADGSNGIRAINVSTLYDPYRPRQGNSPLGDPLHDTLTIEHRDPFSPRDTTVPAPDVLPVVNFTTASPALAIARGLMLDRIADESGRRLRDSWNPGNDVITGAQMDRMRATVIQLP